MPSVRRTLLILLWIALLAAPAALPAQMIRKEGELVLHASTYRERPRNVTAARERLLEILSTALAPRVPRRETKPTRSSRRKRVEKKRRRSEVKRGRSQPRDE